MRIGEKEIAVLAHKHAVAAFELAELLMPDNNRFEQAGFASRVLQLAGEFRLLGIPGWVAAKENK